MTVPTIIIADDHPMFRAALALTVRRFIPEARLVEVGGHAELGKALAENMPVKMVLLDLRMPDTHGLSSLEFLRREYSGISVAVISAGADSETIGHARRLGAAAFIPKSSSVETVAQGISCVIRGETWFPEQHEDPPKPDDWQDRLTTLTPQQFRVLRYLADGLDNRQIAEKLDVSEGTVRAHVTTILRKLCVSTRTQAAILFTELDLQRDAADAS